MNETFANIIGQEGVKRTLSVYLEAFKETERLPFLNLTGGKGSGKSFLVREFRKGLKRKCGKKVPILEVNGASIKNAEQFFEHVYPVWVNNDSFLFIDEIHNIPDKLQQIFLTILNVDKDPVRVVDFEGQNYRFDFTKISFCGGTTDQQKLAEPLRDRLKNIALEPYKPEELFEIFIKNLNYKLEIEKEAKEEIKNSFRGNPRDAVVKAEDLMMFASAQKLNKIFDINWFDFMKTMGVHPLGLSAAEMTVIKVLGERRELSLTSLAAITGFDRMALSREYESILMRKDLLCIEGKRKLTPNGIRFYHKYCKD
jgi:Holliday junction resolvasome RuvABC ATP-dependent DNA helicase subunit